MRTSLLISIILLCLTILGGVYTADQVERVSQRYISAAEEMLVLTEKADWPRAGETADAYQETWDEAVRWLQTLINHEDTDNVTIALLQLKAGIQAQDQAACFEACLLLREHARHLYHRDAFSLGNVL